MTEKTPSKGPFKARAADVMVHGSGWVAQASALALAGLGLDVALTERAGSPLALRSDAAAPPPDHRAMALNPASRDLLLGLGAWPEAGACEVKGMHIHDGTAQLAFSAGEVGASALAWIVAGQALSHAFASALDHSPRVRRVPSVAKLSEASAGLHVLCEGADGLVGRQSPIAAATNASQGYGQHAVACVLALGEAHQNIARQWFDGGAVLAVLPMRDADEPAGHRAALVWSVDDARAKALMHLGEAEFCSELAAAAQLAATPRLASPRQMWPLAASQAPQWMGKTDGQSWVLAGDSAHRVHPLAGLGLNLGFGDVKCLADQLALRQGGAYWRALDDPALLQPYVRERQTKAAQVFAATDGLFQLQRLRKPSSSSLAASALAAAASAWPSLRQTGMRLLQASPAAKRQLILQAMA